MDRTYILHSDALAFINALPAECVALAAVDPPYYGIVDDSWDNQWSSPDAYVEWLVTIYAALLPKLKPTGSLVAFAGLGDHEAQPIFDVVTYTKKIGYRFRNWITWKKRRAYGKSHDYLYCREEILWFSKSHERTGVTFNVPYLAEKRGYAGFNPKYPAKSEFKRVSNVWTDISDAPEGASVVWEDIPELMRPERKCQKPEALLGRVVETHSNPGDLVIDFFSGYGTTGIAALNRGRRFLGCEAIEADARAADARCQKAALDSARRPA